VAKFDTLFGEVASAYIRDILRVSPEDIRVVSIVSLSIYTFHILSALDFSSIATSAYTLSIPIHPCAAICTSGTYSVFHSSFIIDHL
jgi:hypothetical protein